MTTMPPAADYEVLKEKSWLHHWQFLSNIMQLIIILHLIVL